MYSHRFFGGLKAQRTALLAAKDFAPVPLHPTVARALASIAEPCAGPLKPPGASAEIWSSSIQAVKPLIVRSIYTNIAASLFILGGIIASKGVLDYSSNLFLTLAMAGVFLGCEVANNLCQYFELKRRTQVARGIQLHLYARVNQKLLSVDSSEEIGLSKGNLKTLVGSDIETIEDFITAAAANWVPTLILLLVLTPTVYLSSGVLGLVGVGLALLQIPIATLFAKIIEKYQDRSQQHQDALTTLVGEWVKNIRLVRYLGWQESISNEIRERVRRLSVDSSVRHFLVCATYALSYSWWMAPIVGMLLAAVLLGYPLQLSSFFLSIWALSHLTNQIQNIPYSIGLYGAAVAGEKRLAALLAAPDLQRHLLSESSRPTANAQPIQIRLEQVTVEFGSKTALRVPALFLDLTQRTAIVGDVGSGKSLLVELLSGERAPSRGSISVLLDSHDWRPLWGEFMHPHFRSCIAYSPQQPFLSNTSLRHNIDLGDQHPQQDAALAAEAAQMTEDIKTFPNGMEEEVGETGINLSGGQKQRVSLARAFASKRSIFILDDPLSAVDRLTEKALMSRILSATQGVVLVSHRLDELQLCDRVLVLKDGRIVEDGSPAALISDSHSAFNAFLKAAERRTPAPEAA